MIVHGVLQYPRHLYDEGVVAYAESIAQFVRLAAFLLDKSTLCCPFLTGDWLSDVVRRLVLVVL